MKSDRYQALLKKYLKDRCTTAEAEELFAYIRSQDSPEWPEGMPDQWDEQPADRTLNEEKTRQLWQRILRTTRLPSRQKRWYAVAASLAGLLAIATYFLIQSVTTVTYRTAYGETQRVLLPDSSVVTLNGNSSVRFASEWKAREVHLEGEAFFEVRKQPVGPRQKFLVHTQQLDVEVLGTTFNVAQRRDHTQVVLRSGKVRLNTPAGEELLMEPGELAELSETQNNLRKRSVDITPHLAWRDQELIFRQTRLAEIARELEDTYGLDVTFADQSLAEKKLTGTFAADRLEVLLKAMEEVHQLSVTRQGNEITIE